MYSFLELIHERKLDANSDFEKIAQTAIEVYYLPPYPKKEDLRQKGKINRIAHGGLHVSSAVLNLEMQIAFYTKHFPELLEELGTPPDPEIIKLLKLAVTYHDSVNKYESYHNEKEQAENFTKDMLALGFNSDKVKKVANALAQKDTHKSSTIYHALIHDADCLDILRMVKPKNFIEEELVLFHHCKNKKDALIELRQIIKNHFETYTLIKKTRKTKKSAYLHKRCEFAENCYSELKKIELEILHDYIVIECLKQGKAISVHDIPPLDILDMYNRQGENVQEVIYNLTKSEDAKYASTETLDIKQPYLVRGITNNLDVEFEQLTKNTKALMEHKIDSSDKLKQSLKDNKHCPDKFKWRPCSLIMPGIPNKLFRMKQVTVIIDPSSPTVLTPFIYKKNADSSDIEKNKNFIYEPLRGGRKNKQTLLNLMHKHIEQNNRRKGLSTDPGLRYFGKELLDHAEILTTYRPENIKGFIVPDNNPIAAKEALIYRAKFKEHFPQFYRYNTKTGLSLVRLSEIIDQSGIQNPIISPVNSLDSIIQKLNTSPLGIGNISSTSHTSNEIPESYISSRTTVTIKIKTENPLIKTLIKKASFEIAQEFQENSVERKLEFTQNEDHINIEIINNDYTNFTEEQNKEDLNKAVIEVLTRIYHSLLKDTNSIINPEQLIDITRSSSDNTFSFDYPDEKDIRCVAKMKNGDPIIEFYLKDEKKPNYISSTNNLNAIALQYYKHKCNELNILFKQDIIIKHQLRKLAIEKIKFNIMSKNNKNYIEIDLGLLSLSNDKKILDQLIHIFKIPYSKNKFNIVKDDVQKTLKICFPLTQDFDQYYLYMNNHVQDIIKEKTVDSKKMVNIKGISAEKLKILGILLDQSYWQTKHILGFQLPKGIKKIHDYVAKKDLKTMNMKDWDIISSIAFQQLLPKNSPNFFKRDSITTQLYEYLYGQTTRDQSQLLMVVQADYHKYLQQKNMKKRCSGWRK